MGSKKIYHIHIVDSVKGGSGKSSFSARLCHTLISQGKAACIVDLDLLGTSWDHIYAKTLPKVYGKQKRVYLNDLVKDFGYYKHTDFIQKVNISGKTLPVIFADPSSNAKRSYKIRSNSNTTDVSYSFFASIIFELISQLRKEYTDIIFDMPPNSDPYADTVLLSCLKTRKEFQTSLYMVSSLNVAHIKSTFEWYSDLVANAYTERITTKNDFEILYGTKYCPTNIRYDQLSEEMKSARTEAHINWLNRTNTNFFIVFNDIYNRENTISEFNKKKIVIEYAKDDIKSMLAYYFIDFDDDYSRGTDSLLSYDGNREIRFGNPFDIADFWLYNEL